MPHTPINTFCQTYVRQFPELSGLDVQQLEKFIRLLTVFSSGSDIVDLHITFTLSLKAQSDETSRSFTPIVTITDTKTQTGSNDISFAQQTLARQIQNLNGSELSMPYIKDADGKVQFLAMKPLLCRKTIRIVDVGGGRGETHAVFKACADSNADIHLLNIEPHEPFAQSYLHTYKQVGIENVQILQKKAQAVSSAEIMGCFGGKKADAVFASHYFYFELNDMFKATLEYTNKASSKPLEEHPLWKYFDMMKEDGVFVVTLQSGSGARVMRNALLENHGLNPSSDATADETTALLSSFGNTATFLRNFEVFANLYREKTGFNLHVKMHLAVANVPLGAFYVEQDALTGGYVIHNPNGDDSDPAWLAPKMLDFYGNWKELETLATLTQEKAMAMSPDELKKLGISCSTSCSTADSITLKRRDAKKAQETFLHILSVFAIAQQNMQHPNSTLEITKARSDTQK